VEKLCGVAQCFKIDRCDARVPVQLLAQCLKRIGEIVHDPMALLARDEAGTDVGEPFGIGQRVEKNVARTVRDPGVDQRCNAVGLVIGISDTGIAIKLRAQDIQSGMKLIP
jgi:hypothetical protein